MAPFKSVFPLVALLFASLSSSVIATDQDLLNLGVNLECLEAQAYWFAAYGEPLPSSDLGGGPVAKGGRKATLSSPEVQNFSRMIASTERKHLELLRNALGSSAVPCPAINISAEAFTTVAKAAFPGASVQFDPYRDDKQFLLMSYLFEDVGVTFLRGILPMVSNQYISTTGGLLGTEAYQAGAINAMLAARADEDAGIGGGKTVAQVADALSMLRNKLAGGAQSDVGITVPPSESIVGSSSSGQSPVLQTTNADAAQGLVFSRSPEQTKSIVFGTGTATKPGLFFPDGFSSKQ